MCLADQQKYEAAAQACRKAIDIRPDWADGYFYLGYVLDQQKNHLAAAEAFRKAIALRPDWAGAYYNLGYALIRQGKPSAAEAALRKAINLRPDFAPAHNNLGMTLLVQGKQREAEAAFRRAITLQPDDVDYQNNLGMALAKQRKLSAAELAFRKAIDLRPRFALPYVNLGYLVGEQGRFDEALALVKQGVALLPAADPDREQAQSLVLRYERCMALDAKLPAVLRGAEKPADAPEHIGFAQMCVLKKLYVTAANFYDRAFTDDPRLGEDASEALRYQAACAAALASCARGGDTDTLSDKERARWRHQALVWLKQDLTWWNRALEKDNAKTRDEARQWLRRCLTDNCFDGVRARARLSSLSDEERKEWQQLWHDVQVLLSNTGARE
jgi:Flp pilus assembly protein TadD